MVRYATLLGLLTLTGSAARPAQDQHRCTYDRRAVCDERGCRPIPVGQSYLLIPDRLDLELATAPRLEGDSIVSVRRCDEKGCTSVPVLTAPSGAFLNAWADGGGYVIKFVSHAEALGPAARRGQFVEVATAMLTTYVSYGACPWH
jgi:hypothetical protein